MADIPVDDLTVIWFRSVYGEVARSSQGNLALLGPQEEQTEGTISLVALQREVIGEAAAIFLELTAHEPGHSFSSPPAEQIWLAYQNQIALVMSKTDPKIFSREKLRTRKGQRNVTKFLIREGVIPLKPSQLLSIARSNKA